MSEEQPATTGTPDEPGAEEVRGSSSDATDPGDQQITIIGPDGQPIGTVSASALAAQNAADEGSEDPDDGDGRGLTDLVEQPAKVMRIGSMIRQLLEEVKAAPLDEASRLRLKEIHSSSIKELEQGLAPELVEELHRLSLPFDDEATPSEPELRIAQAQLVGWLEGLFHGIQTAIYAQQMAARAQFEQIRKALPPGASMPSGMGAPGQSGPGGPDGPNQPGSEEHRGGMYL
ncbi:MAG: bacterial proteasome activator family protein [Nocardioides sp.]